MVLIPGAPTSTTSTPPTATAFSSTTATAEGRTFAEALSAAGSSSTKWFLGSGFINNQRTAFDRLAIQFLDGFFDIHAGNQLDKCETAG
jgi:hypothetical protein